MAKFNNNVVDANNDKMQMECAIFLQACLSEEEYEKLKDDWNNIGGAKTIKWWKFVFDNVQVRYKA